jgi:apolipoprotein N-acyltransferase
MASVKPTSKRRRSTIESIDAGGNSVADETETSKAADVVPRAASVPWYRSTVVLGLASGLALWAAFPPLGLWPLAWVAPVGWVLLACDETLLGRRPYLMLWAAGLLHWMGLLYFLVLPHWAGIFGWIAIGLYLAFYIPVFVGLTRVAVHRLRISVVVAAPVVWTGLELARGHLFTGFSIGLLGHTQVHWPALIQIADALGAYGVSFVVMLVAACVARMLPLQSRSWTLWPAAPAVAVVGAALLYGQYRLNEQPPDATDGRVLRVALIQGSSDTIFEYNPERDQQAFRDYFEESLRARDEHPDLDLVIWPESMFTAGLPDLIVEGDVAPPPEAGMTATEYQDRLRKVTTHFENKSFDVSQHVNTLVQGDDVRRLQVALLVGTETLHYDSQPPRRYNSAILIDPSGQVVDRYYKMHRVMFGEYVPLGDLLPWLYKLTPLPEGLTAGDSPRVFSVAGFRLSPSICFESTVPHLIRRQVAELTRQNAAPDLLVNVTNDGWFWGSNALDLHLACGVFRAVENRRPFLVAANTGLSAFVDGNGRIVRQSPRRATDRIYAEVRRDGRHGLYQIAGDWPAAACLAFCLGLAGLGASGRWRTRRRPTSANRE